MQVKQVGWGRQVQDAARWPSGWWMGQAARDKWHGVRTNNCFQTRANAKHPRIAECTSCNPLLYIVWSRPSVCFYTGSYGSLGPGPSGPAWTLGERLAPPSSGAAPLAPSPADYAIPSTCVSRPSPLPR